MKDFRDLLLASGVSPRDIADAVRQSRQATERVGAGAKLLARMLAHAGAKAKPGTRRQIAALGGAKLFQKISHGADVMLARGPTMQHASNRRAARRK